MLALSLPSEFVVGNHALAATMASVILAAGLLICIALLRRATMVTPGLVTIRGLCTTSRIPAWEVARFEPPPPYGRVFGRVALRVLLTDGGVRYSGCFTNTPVDGDGVGVEECNELNRWLALQTSSGYGTEALPDRRRNSRWTTLLWVSWLVLVAFFAVFCVVGILGVIADPSFGG